MKILVFVLLLSGQRVWAQSAFNASPNFPTGSTRALGMGGAFIGLSDGATGIVYNSAGLAFGKWWVDFSTAQNYVLDGQGETDDGRRLPRSFGYQSLAFRLDDVAFGIARSYPLSIEILEGGSQSAKLELVDWTLALVYRANKKLGVGLNIRSIDLNRSLQLWNQPIYSDQKNQVSYSIGLMYRLKERTAFGLTYTPSTSFSAAHQGDSTVINHWFRPVSQTEMIRFGAFFKATSKTGYFFDVDFKTPTSDSVAITSPFYSVYPPSIRTEWFRILRGGVEYVIQDKKQRGVTVRFGGYREPALSEGMEDRFHLTFGLEARLGALIIAASIDEALEFANSSQGVGVNISFL